MTSQKQFLIVGCQRSGTTLLRLIFDSHPDIACYDETRSYQILGGTYLPEIRPVIGLKVPQLTEQLCSDRLRDDSAVRNTEIGLPNAYSNEPVVFVVRDPRDTVASMIALRGWLDRYGLPVLAAKTKDACFRRRYAKPLSLIQGSRFPRVAAAALIWRYKTDSLNDYLRRGMAIQPLSYERLVADPEPELRRVCKFIGVRWDPVLLRHSDCPHRDLHQNGKATGNTDPYRPIDGRSLRRFEACLNLDELREVAEIAIGSHAMAFSEADGHRERRFAESG